MARIHGNSSCVASADYDKELKTLTISFVKGGSHVYTDVPEDVAESLAKAGSKGKFFNAAIRNEY